MFPTGFWFAVVPAEELSAPAWDLGTSHRLQIQIDPNRDMVRRFFPTAHVAVDSDIDQPVAPCFFCQAPA